MTAAADAALPPALPLSAAPRQLGLNLRPRTDHDHPFLAELYLAVRWPEFAQAGWPDAVLRRFLLDQFALQTRHYDDVYRDAEFTIVERGGAAIGRLYLFRGATDHRIVDISLKPDACGQGIGTALLTTVLDEAFGQGKTVSIHVEQFNPALRLYRRLGFREIGERGPYLLMEVRSDQRLSPQS
ncbi:hypothetical protein GCM10011611_10350 [Aliidongia dinghuensis]|uniref:N-acetyltransferase domain-containing protein n=1 Tax=Aliidongia dinghuensis TaxID=1867774 RepID=A0A8J3E113_9PROT|nr:GNAT family N-acetyltransferase [Aliidongia dinghuensis]GGF06790.1 hypothetical protein GCM10011611_10350 [Aliidongia dinghuensis]